MAEIDALKHRGLSREIFGNPSTFLYYTRQAIGSSEDFRLFQAP